MARTGRDLTPALHNLTGTGDRILIYPLTRLYLSRIITTTERNRHLSVVRKTKRILKNSLYTIPIRKNAYHCG